MHSLPAYLARWVDAAMGEALPVEPRSRCNPCVMCEGGGPFDPKVKCCGYHPLIPSFAVGMIIAGGSEVSSASRAEVLHRIRDRRGATPFGLEPGTRFGLAYQRAVAEGRFGRDASVVCPFFDSGGGGSCGIAPYREAVCVTFFCRCTRRAIGSRFWLALRDLLLQAQRALASWCLLELELDPSALLELHHDDGSPRRLARGELQGGVDADGTISAGLAARIWGRWRGREEAFYRACAERVGALDWDQVRAIGGVALALCESRARARLGALGQSGIPEVLCLANVETTELEGGGEISIRTDETAHDPIVVSHALADLLTRFDGRPTEEVLREASAKGQPIGNDTLRLLVAQGVLAAPDGRDEPAREQGSGALEPDDHLCFFRSFRSAPISSELVTGEGGKPILEVRCGPREISFDEPDLIELGRKLVLFQNGFRAGDALAWSPPGVTYTWDRISELLEALLDANVLRRIRRGQPETR